MQPFVALSFFDLWGGTVEVLLGIFLNLCIYVLNDLYEIKATITLLF